MVYMSDADCDDCDCTDRFPWETVIRRALADNESLCLDDPADRDRLVAALCPLMESAERHGYVRGAMDVSEQAEKMANATAYSAGYLDGAEPND